MIISSRTPEGRRNRCPVCGHSMRIDPSRPFGDAPCPRCGCLVLFEPRRPASPDLNPYAVDPEGWLAAAREQYTTVESAAAGAQADVALMPVQAVPDWSEDEEALHTWRPFLHDARVAEQDDLHDSDWRIVRDLLVSAVQAVTFGSRRVWERVQKSLDGHQADTEPDCTPDRGGGK